MSGPDISELQQEILAEVLRAHQDDPHGDLSGARLRVHVTLHTVVETQLRANDPPCVRRALSRLLAAGLDRHAAVHAIGDVAVREIVEVVGQGKSYDEARYAAALDALDTQALLAADASEPNAEQTDAE